MTAGEERAVNQAVSDALGGVGLTAFDRLSSELRQVAQDRYRERLAAERPAREHMQRIEP